MRGAAHATAPRPIPDRSLDPVAGDRCPRRLAPATIQEYQPQVVAFARWMETMLEVPFAPESITAYRMEQYLATLEAQLRSKARKSATVNKAVAACPHSAPGWWQKAPVPTRPPSASAPWASRLGRPSAVPNRRHQAPR